METTATVLKGKITDLQNVLGYAMHSGQIVEAYVRFKGLLGPEEWVKLPVRVTGSEGKWREVGAKIIGTTTWNACAHTVVIVMTEYFNETAEADFEMEEINAPISGGEDDPSDPRNMGKDLS